MSTAEYTAHNIYERYNLGALPQEVKRQLMIIFLNEKDTEDEVLSQSQKEEFRARAKEALDEIKAGQARPIEEFFEEVEGKYPELCK